MAVGILCPNCQDDLMSQNTQILSSQVTLEYEVVGELEVDCERCGEEVGQLLKDVINAYSRLKQRVILPSNVFGDLQYFLSAIEEVLELLEQQRGGVRRASATRLYFGTEDGRSRSFKAVGEKLGVSHARAWDLVHKDLRTMINLSIAIVIHRAR